jgi:hypothetical protein
MSTCERRKSPRVNVDFVTVEVYMKLPSTTELAEICTVINLSISGMRFKSDRKFLPEQLLRLTFVLPESMIIIRSNANIVHCSEVERRKYSYGVQFVGIGEMEQKLINHFIQKTINEEDCK